MFQHEATLIKLAFGIVNKTMNKKKSTSKTILRLYMAAAFSFLDLQVKTLVAILDCFKSFAFDLESQ